MSLCFVQITRFIEIFWFKIVYNFWGSYCCSSLNGGELPQLQIPGLVNVDFADVRAIMANAGSSLMGIGTATGNFKKLVLLECTYPSTIIFWDISKNIHHFDSCLQYKILNHRIVANLAVKL